MGESRPVERLIVRRAIGAVADSLLVFGAIAALWKFQPWAAPDATGNYGPAGCVLFLVSLFLYFAYFVALESLLGRTWGMAIASIHVQAVHGGHPTAMQALQRHLLDAIELQPLGIPAAIAVALTDPPRRLGDLWAKTLVVRDTR